MITVVADRPDSRPEEAEGEKKLRDKLNLRREEGFHSEFPWSDFRKARNFHCSKKLNFIQMLLVSIEIRNPAGCDHF